MHPSPDFRGPSRADDLAFARSRGFGVLCLAHADAVLTAHVPFVLSADGLTAGLHLARSNPLLTALPGDRPALLSVHGPDAYVSPRAYGLPDQVPTWNYVAVNLRGTLSRLPDHALRPHLAELAAVLEGGSEAGAAWTLDEVSPTRLAALERGIAPVCLRIDAVESTWKLGQNKPLRAVLGAADAVEVGPWGAERGELARLMRLSAEGPLPAGGRS